MAEITSVHWQLWGISVDGYYMSSSFTVLYGLWPFIVCFHTVWFIFSYGLRPFLLLWAPDIVIHASVFFSFQKISKNRSLLHFQNFFLERTSSMIQFWYWGWNRQHPCFQTHQQLYQYYTHNRLDLLPKWLHESKIPKSEKVNFSIFMVSPIESSVQRESSSHPYYQIFSGRIP